MSFIPRSVAEGPMGVARAAVDSPTFREGMSRVASAVHVITTAGSAGDGGFTATAVTSVADQPPTLLVCVNQASRTGALLRGNGVFAVNTLPGEAQAVADLFSGRTGVTGEARFAAAGAWTRGEATGVPLLAAALVAFECRLVDARDVATHQLLIGEVVGVHLGQPGASLVYKGRAYRVLGA
jgi:flavin reductase